MGRLRRVLRRRRGVMPLDRSEYAQGGKRPLDNPDALTAADGGENDDGRPRT